MLGGGQLTGWFIPEGPLPDKIQQALETLAAPERLRERYGAPADAPALQFATGDGNHSMAAARARWEQIRETLTPQQRLEHPARWALAEVVNLQDESLEIEPIHRLVAGVNPQTVLQDAVNYFAAQGAHAQLLEQAPEKEDPWAVRWVAGEKTGWLCIQPNGRWALPVAALQAFLDDRLPHWQGAKPDYYPRGRDAVQPLRRRPEHRLRAAGVPEGGSVPGRGAGWRSAPKNFFHGPCAGQTLLHGGPPHYAVIGETRRSNFRAA